jgi:hypothetical protein
MEVLKYINDTLVSYTLAELYDNRIGISVSNVEEFIDIIDKLDATGLVYMPTDVKRDKVALYNRGTSKNSCILIERRPDLGKCEYILRYYSEDYVTMYAGTIKKYSEVTLV